MYKHTDAFLTNKSNNLVPKRKTYINIYVYATRVEAVAELLAIRLRI